MLNKGLYGSKKENGLLNKLRRKRVTSENPSGGMDRCYQSDIYDIYDFYSGEVNGEQKTIIENGIVVDVKRTPLL